MLKPLPESSCTQLKPGRTCLEFHDLTLGYGGHPAVHGLSGSIAHGTLMAIAGPNGSGKSTLLKAIVGLLTPVGGSLNHSDGCRKAYLPQSAELDAAFPATVLDLVKLGLWPRRGLWGRIDKSDKARLQEAIDQVGLTGFEKRPLNTLSGGQLQRALFARVIVQDADLILLDEPFNAIDSQTVTDLMALITAWHNEGRTIITVLHDLDLTRAWFPECLLLSREPVAWGKTNDVLTSSNLRIAGDFRAAWDTNAPWCDDPNHTHHSGGSSGPVSLARATQSGTESVRNVA